MAEETKALVPTDIGVGTTEKNKGLTLEELRYKRAVYALKKEYAKERFFTDLDALRQRLPGQHSADSPERSIWKSMGPGLGSVVTKAFAGLNYLDYAVMGFSVFSTIRRITRLFRRNKK